LRGDVDVVNLASAEGLRGLAREPGREACPAGFSLRLVFCEQTATASKEVKGKRAKAKGKELGGQEGERIKGKGSRGG
jgi:hypothetical protein